MNTNVWHLFYKCRWCGTSFAVQVDYTHQDFGQGPTLGHQGQFEEMTKMLRENRPTTHSCSPEGEPDRRGLADPVGMRPAYADEVSR